MATKKEKSWDDAENEVSNSWMKFNVPLEDKVMGTLLAKRTMNSTIPGQEGKIVNIYEMKASEGSYHVLDDKKRVVDEPVVLAAGDFVSIGGTAVIDRQMQNIKVGQIIGLKFIEEKPSKTKGFAPAKIVKVYAPKNADGSYTMDEEVTNEQNVKEF